MAKNGSDLCNFYNTGSKQDVLNCFIKKYFLLFFTNFKLLMFCNNIVKISESLNKCCLKSTYPIEFCIFCRHFNYGEK